MRKKNIIRCENCRKLFNNYYLNPGKFRKLSCSVECHRELRRKNYVKLHREKRQKLRSENRCIICGKKVKPIIVYHQYCPKHKPKKK